MPGLLSAVGAVVAVGAIALAVPSSPSSTPPSSTPASVPPASVGGRFLTGAGQPDGGLPAAAPISALQARAAPGGTVPRSRFRWPLDPTPRVLRRFAVGPNPWSPGHRGVDVAASAGQSVLAAGPGVVTFAGRIAGVGAVSVTHVGGLRTTYQPVSAGVHIGDRVEAGQELGTLGDWPGHCAGPCLHWGALRGRTYLDPLALLGLLPPVLLPLSR